MALFAPRDRVQSSISQVQARIRWTPTAPTSTQPNGAGLIRIGGRGLAPVMSGLWASVTGAVAASYQGVLIPIAENAFREWPVKSGLSKSRLRTLVFTTDASLTVRIVNLAPYASTIHRGQTARDLLVMPVEKAKSRIAAAIKRGIRG